MDLMQHCDATRTMERESCTYWEPHSDKRCFWIQGDDWCRKLYPVKEEACGVVEPALFMRCP